jgi:hypothetical protein
MQWWDGGLEGVLTLEEKQCGTKDEAMSRAATLEDWRSAPALLNVRQASELTGFSESYLWELVRSGRIPSVLVTRKKRILNTRRLAEALGVDLTA